MRGDLAKSVLRFELISQPVQLLHVDTWTKGRAMGPDTERGHPSAGSTQQAECKAQRIVEHLLETLLTPPRKGSQFTHHIVVQRDRRPHIGIIVRAYDAVKMRIVRERSEPLTQGAAIE